MEDGVTAGGESVESERTRGSGLRTLLLLGLSFVAGYLVGRSKSGVSLDELESVTSEEEPMEIEIEDTETAETGVSETDEEASADEESDDEE